ncbi:MAG: hypothetical protein DMG68_21945, partial [Acidobacteria bacterium]
MNSGHAIAPASVETRTIHKLRIRIIPFLFLLYIVAYLDRINIGFAALTMNKELAITSQQFGLLVGVFFFGYFLFEIPSNLLLHKFGARIWIARILITWGIIAALTGIVHSVSQLYVARFLLGVMEAGFFPGILLYLTYWFRQREQAQTIALFMAGLPITSILGAPLSGLILDHVHWLGLSSWRWLLVLEGLPAIACGVLTYLLLPSRPPEANFLTREEKDWIRREAKEAPSLCDPGPDGCKGMASGSNRFHHGERFICHELLDATACEVVLSGLLQHSSGISGHDSAFSRTGCDDSRLAQFRSAARTSIPYSDSGTHWRN